MAEEETLWTMDMHSTIPIENMEVTRVPGGWVYKSISTHFADGHPLNGSEAAVFVPYVKEECRYD